MSEEKYPKIIYTSKLEDDMVYSLEEINEERQRRKALKRSGDHTVKFHIHGMIGFANIDVIQSTTSVHRKIKGKYGEYIEESGWSEKEYKINGIYQCQKCRKVISD